jgi:surfeit locus 1 family protein
VKTGSKRFWIVALATVVTAGVTATLGFWQLSRAAEKQSLETMITERGALPPLGAPALVGAANPQEVFYRTARLTGKWVPKASVFLDNRPMNGRSGFILVTPLVLQELPQAILVQRGWVPRDFVDRTRVPEIDTPEGWVTVEGRLAPPPSHLFELGASQPGAIRQNIAPEAFSQETGLRLLEASLLQTAPADKAFVRDWPRFAAGVQTHYGYAVQWFAMSAVAIFLFFWFQIISPRRKQRPHGTDDSR